MKLSHTVLMIAITGLAACSTGETTRPLHQLRNNSGSPEEFSIVPNKPLEQPANYSELPAPTPGSANRTDATPIADAVAALGGNPARLQAQGVPGNDMALLNRATRFGTDPQIRAELAAADAEFRRSKSIYNWKLFPDDEYNRAYRSQQLDAYGVLEAWRRVGVRTPSAPPEGYGEE